MESRISRPLAVSTAHSSLLVSLSDGSSAPGTESMQWSKQVLIPFVKVALQKRSSWSTDNFVARPVLETLTSPGRFGTDFDGENCTTYVINLFEDIKWNAFSEMGMLGAPGAAAWKTSCPPLENLGASGMCCVGQFPQFQRHQINVGDIPWYSHTISPLNVFFEISMFPFFIFAHLHSFQWFNPMSIPLMWHSYFRASPPLRCSHPIRSQFFRSSSRDFNRPWSSWTAKSSCPRRQRRRLLHQFASLLHLLMFWCSFCFPEKDNNHAKAQNEESFQTCSNQKLVNQEMIFNRSFGCCERRTLKKGSCCLLGPPVISWIMICWCLNPHIDG